MSDKKIVIVFFGLVILGLAGYLVWQMKKKPHALAVSGTPSAFSALGNPQNTVSSAMAATNVQELAQEKHSGLGAIGQPATSQQSAWLSQFSYGTGVPML